ncbi:MAG TPA: crotonase/enoyl-CoA hydratase family protein [Rhodospirillales bacterium]|nr:crotonase/enoyl-CoA hydratase family protein [Rhodospirillales bacterium]
MSYLAYQPAVWSQSGATTISRTAPHSAISIHRRPPAGLKLESLPELAIEHDPARRIVWQYMQPIERPSFTPGLLRDMTAALDLVESAFAAPGEDKHTDIAFLVLASKLPRIFNLGGDLPHFIDLIERKDRERLQRYARVCAVGQYRRAIGLGLPICTVALVQGDALGGGFEAALAHDVIIAERSASFGLPEVLFNLFPGMGAYSFLVRRLEPARAERMILSGRLWSAEELYEMGIIDRLVDDGAGVDAVHAFVAEFERAAPARRALLRTRRIVNPVSLGELTEIAELWVDAALQLGTADLRRMRHLARAQDRRCAADHRGA